MPQYFLAVNHDEASDAEMASKTMEDFQPMFEAVGAFNAELQETLRKLKGELAGAQAVYAETYSLASAIVASPSDYG